MSVILFTGGGGSAYEGGFASRGICLEGLHPGKRGGLRMVGGGGRPLRELEKRVVHILLECFLVEYDFLMILFCS